MALDSTIVNAILAQLQATTAKLAAITAKVDAASEALADHNVDVHAHPDLRTLIDSLGEVGTPAITAAVTEHDHSATAHASLRTMITNLQTSVTNLNTKIGDGVSAHNTDPSAHPGIQTTLTQLTADMDTVKDTLSLSTTKVDDLQDQVIDTQNSVATTGLRMSLMSFSLMSVADDQAVAAETVDNVTSTLTDTVSNVTDSQVAIEEVRVNSSFSGQAVDMLGFTHTMPSVVAKSTVVPVKLSGVTIPAGETLTYSIEAAGSGFTFSKMADIAQDEVFDVIIPAGAQPGQVVYFIVTAKMSVSGDTSRVAVGTKINTPPSIDSLQSTVPAAGEPGQAYDIKFWGAMDLDGQDISFELIPLTGGLTFSKSTGIITNETVKLNIPSNLTRDSSATFKVRVKDTLGEYVEKSYSLLATKLPDVTNLTHTIPGRAVPNKEYLFKIQGAVSADGSVITYSVEALNNSPISFSKTSGIADGSLITMTVPAGVTRGSTHTVRITVITSLGSKVTMDVPVKINQLPSLAGLVCNLPAQVNGASTTPFTLVGASDADSDALTYSIVGITPGLVFSKSSGIAANESVDLVVPRVSVETTYSFKIQATDALGESVVTANYLTIKVVPVFIAETPNIIDPAEGAQLPSDVVTFNFSPLVVSIA